MQASPSRTTLMDVARRAGVSTATASRVLGGSRDRVSEALAARVHAAAAELDYVANPHARALVRAESTAVAVIVHDLADAYFSEIARGALRVAAADDRLVMICDTFRDPRREVAYLNEMRAQRIHAVLVAGGSNRDPEAGDGARRALAAYRREGGRVAVMVPGEGHPAAVPDNAAGGTLAARHLIELGHRSFGVISGPSHLSSVVERLAGFDSVLLDAGLAPSVVVSSDFTRGGGADAAETLVGRSEGVTAVLALNDLMAAGTIRRLAQMGLSVPGDMSVMGFDDIPMAADFHPGLTTIRVPMEEIGAEAMRLALTSMPGVEDHRTTVFDTELVVRASTGPVPFR
ncbi:MAG TPA: LacI family DNA-binding transcriptional regulator [Acidimicrobiia bacterium]|nr:LacI family DNA-binding transcriptional regulator [Acidimicrobiia bacterium]